MQRVVIYSDVKKRSCQTFTNILDILRVLEKNSIKNKEIFCAFRLDKLLWSDK